MPNHYEAIRTADPLLRQRLVSLLTERHWQRLMPEAYYESQQVLLEIRRLRQQWLLPRRDQQHFDLLKRDWVRLKGGFWDRARFDADGEARAEEPQEMLDRARQCEHGLWQKYHPDRCDMMFNLGRAAGAGV